MLFSIVLLPVSIYTGIIYLLHLIYHVNYKWYNTFKNVNIVIRSVLKGKDAEVRRKKRYEKNIEVRILVLC